MASVSHVTTIPINNNNNLLRNSSLVLCVCDQEVSQEMKYVLLSILLSLVQRHVYGGNTLRFEQNVVKRQAEYSACITMYSTLSTDELNCLPNYNFSNPLAGLENGLLSPSDLTGVCRSTFCMNVASSLLETCKVCEYVTDIFLSL